MVFQSYALFPHLSVFENVAYGLRVRGLPRASDISRRVTETLRMVQLDGYGPRRIGQLSGGQQQRVALADDGHRACCASYGRAAGVCLDRQLESMSNSGRRLTQLGRTTLYVTHDQEEALVMSDRIGVMRDGRIEQIQDAETDPLPATCGHSSPASSAESNLLRGRVVKCTGPKRRSLLRAVG